MSDENTKFERIIDFSPAYDKRNPNPKKNYGIGSVQIRFVLRKDNKAVQFLFGTDWYLPETVKEYKQIGNKHETVPCNLRGRSSCGVEGWDVGYHSPTSTYKDQPLFKKCDYIKGGCYYSGSGLYAHENSEILIREGSEGVWKFLEKEWIVTFGRKNKKKGKGKK